MLYIVQTANCLDISLQTFPPCTPGLGHYRLQKDLIKLVSLKEHYVMEQFTPIHHY